MFLKRLYPNYLILFRKSDNKITSIDIDRKLLYYLKYKNIKKLKINHIIVSSTNELEVYTYYKKNNYYLYYYRYYLSEIIKLLYTK